MTWQKLALLILIWVLILYEQTHAMVALTPTHICKTALHACASATVAQRAAHELYIIVPGTWAFKNTWFRLGGDFFNSLHHAVDKQHAHVLWFNWLGDYYLSSRKKGAAELAHFLTCFPQKSHIHLIAHSHGVNVCSHASQLLTELEIKPTIKTLYALGGPIDANETLPNMEIIELVYNLYSKDDWIQPAFGFKQTMPPGDNIHNLRVFVEGKDPDHYKLHCPIVGKWLTHLPNINCPQDGEVHFFAHRPPSCHIPTKTNGKKQ